MKSSLFSDKSENQPTFWRYMLLPSLGSKKQETSMKQAGSRTLLGAFFMLVSCLAYPECTGDMFLRNVG
jgi:hypothetical protein